MNPDNQQFARDLTALLQNANTDIALIEACGAALSRKNFLMGRLIDEMQIVQQVKLAVMEQIALPQITPASEARRLMLAEDIAESLPRLLRTKAA